MIRRTLGNNFCYIYFFCESFLNIPFYINYEFQIIYFNGNSRIFDFNEYFQSNNILALETLHSEIHHGFRREP